MLAIVPPGGALAEQASAPGSPQAAGLDVDAYHGCALLPNAAVRCWGHEVSGRLGLAGASTIGDDETPAAAGPVDLGPGRTARAIATGLYHTCAVLDDGSVRCWGYGANGRLGYGSRDSVGDDETPGSLAPVDLGRSATAITVGEAHSCAILDDANVRCWGYAGQGQLGYGSEETIGDNEAPSATGPVDLGPGAAVVAISAGDVHTCAVLASGAVRCWGYARYGLLGNGSANNVGDDEIPVAVGAVDLGAGRRATAISAASLHNCARLDNNAALRCWGYGGGGRLGNCSDAIVGDDESPGSIAPVELDAPTAGCPAAGPSAAAGAAAGAARARRLTAERLRLRRWSRCMTAAQRRVGRARARQVCAKRHGRTRPRAEAPRARGSA